MMRIEISPVHGVMWLDLADERYTVLRPANPEYPHQEITVIDRTHDRDKRLFTILTGTERLSRLCALGFDPDQKYGAKP
jgi:hypothetical protein